MTLVEDKADGLASRIKTRRSELEMSQAELGSAAGVSQSTIARLETGERLPSYSLLLRLAKALKVDPGYLTR